MRTVWMLSLLALTSMVEASEFKHIKLNPQFEQYLTRDNLKSIAPRSSKAAKNVVPTQKIEVIFRESILGSANLPQPDVIIDKVRALGTKSNWTPIPVDGDESLLYSEIRKHLENSHREIALGQVQQINLINRQFNLGSSNNSGYSWQKPFGAIQVYADRQVMPNLFGPNWLIQDTFTFQIEASSFLERLNEAGLADMNDTQIGAFAGLTFRRTYTFYHYAASYEEGLSAVSTKLFLPFLFFNRAGLERLGNEEIIKRDDNWTIRAGGLIETPSWYGLSIAGGILAEAAYQQTTSVQSNHNPSPDKHRFQLNVVSKKSAEIGATLELQLDFFKLLQFSLFRFDLQYEYAAGKDYTLGMNASQWEAVKADPEKSSELAAVLRGRGEIRTLEPYIARMDDTSSSTLQSRTSILLWGKLNKTKTEQIKVIKDEIVRTFYKSYAQNVRVVQNFWSRLFSAIFYKLLKLPIGASNAAQYTRQITTEYEATHPQATDPKIIRLEKSEQFSFVLTQSYDATKTTRWLDRKIKNDAIWFIDVFTSLPKSFKTDVRNDLLRGPLRVESHLRVEKAGFEYLVSSNNNEVFGKLAVHCGSQFVTHWMDPVRRARMLQALQYYEEGCVKDLGLKYLGFKNDFIENAFKPSLAKFQDFIESYYKEAQSIDRLIDLFGEENVFFHGRLQATTPAGSHFVTNFSKGLFRGMGVIDNFKRAEGSRAPASVYTE